MKKMRIKAMRKEAYNYAGIGTMTTLFIVVSAVYIFTSVTVAFVHLFTGQ